MVLTPFDFYASLRDELERFPDERQVLLYVHGFNTTFDQAAVRTAQLGVDLRARGPTAFFSWASAGKFTKYMADEASVEANAHQLASFLQDLALVSGVDRVHVIAHSMGNRALIRAIQSLPPVDAREGIRFGQIVLAAPDVDADLLRTVAPSMSMVCERVTMYVSECDYAIKASSLLHGYARAGSTLSVAKVEGIDIVHVPKLKLRDPLWHSYYAECDAVLSDIYTVLHSDTPPAYRQRLEPRQGPDKERYWELSA